MDLGLTGRTYIVTGGSRGLGRASVDALVGEGARVVVAGRSAEQLRQVEAEYGGAVATVVADNADPDTPARLIGVARDHFGGLDGALISVGGPPAGNFASVPEDDWRSGFETVFLGSVRLIREIGAVLGDGGSLALVLSSSVREPIAGLAVSNGLRPGLAMVAKSLASEWGPRGVRVNGLLPGRVATDRLAAIDAAADDPAAARKNAEDLIPLRRYGAPEEFGRVSAFVLSPAASYLSGVMLPVDGGALRGF